MTIDNDALQAIAQMGQLHLSVSGRFGIAGERADEQALIAVTDVDNSSSQCYSS